jgi:hypothetical protein
MLYECSMYSGQFHKRLLLFDPSLNKGFTYLLTYTLIILYVVMESQSADARKAIAAKVGHT